MVVLGYTEGDHNELPVMVQKWQHKHRRNHPMGPVGRVPSKNWEPWDQYHLVPPTFMTGCNFFDVIVSILRIKRLKLKLSFTSNGRFTFPAASSCQFYAADSHVWTSSEVYFKVQYFSFVDAAVTALEKRYNQAGLQSSEVLVCCTGKPSRNQFNSHMP